MLIALGASGVNPLDAVVRAGSYQPRDGAGGEAVDLRESGFAAQPFTLGWDVAGTVIDVGPGVSVFQPSDEVFGLLAFPELASAHADYVLASPNELVHIPDSLTMQQAGALPLVGLTAWQALVGIANITAGQRVLVHAAAGGVGHIAVQIAKARGAYVIGTASAANREFVLELGADEVIDYRATEFEKVVDPVDVVFDLVGGAYAERSLAILKPDGHLIAAVGVYLGITPERATQAGVRFGYVDVRPSAADLTELVRLAEAGALTVRVAHAIPLADIAKAHELVEGAHVAGKVVVVP
ncbi:NADP-dependent oxidoreductase [Nocardia huaxiensis]|uniref:NADP-dependent oxidoreductase n=1 Tax=Nocardia huaxiensis TaxID=2755382 RepID=UPI001FD410E0|nr:NADP-dependent oxidoreductase [Nocardia huaxiensis]